jgi:uncharacterized membrane protein YvbJ
MICPSCGFENQEDSPFCSKCHYKFQFGHAYNDPKNSTFPNFLKSGSKKTKAVRIGVLAILFVAFALVILSWIKFI